MALNNVIIFFSQILCELLSLFFTLHGAHTLPPLESSSQVVPVSEPKQPLCCPHRTLWPVRCRTCLLFYCFNWTQESVRLTYPDVQSPHLGTCLVCEGCFCFSFGFLFSFFIRYSPPFPFPFI
eukprot:TRINITY_DN28921_c0_g1_i1.p1 TRINITY_DN28921_c0_g1~~TRINITY_DN28921_c0_g1_i1.p1  ORF type:complete len:123 (+),score=3.62 TRINITY_DN28921_c0_g1_i1:203-571(+)